MRVRLVLDANRPMKWGLIVAGVGVLVYLTHWLALPGVFAMKLTAIGLLIAGAAMYFIGRTAQIFKKRY